MAVREYVGARYVPLFAEPAQWSDTRTYEPLTIVMNEGNSFTSRQFVPAGIDISDNDYWAETGNYNAQVEQYRQEVGQYKKLTDKLWDDTPLNIGNRINNGEDLGALVNSLVSTGAIDLYIPEGSYTLKTPIEAKQLRLTCSEHAIITAQNTMEYMVFIGKDGTERYRYNGIHGGVWDCNLNAKNGICLQNSQYGTIENLCVQNFIDVGIYCGYGSPNYNAGATFISNITLIGNNANLNDTGLIMNYANDSWVSDVTIRNAFTGIELNSANVRFYGIHGWIGYSGKYSGSKMVNQTITGANFWVNCCVDTYETGFYFKSVYPLGVFSNISVMCNKAYGDVSTLFATTSQNMANNSGIQVYGVYVYSNSGNVAIFDNYLNAITSKNWNITFMGLYSSISGTVVTPPSHNSIDIAKNGYYVDSQIDKRYDFNDLDDITGYFTSYVGEGGANYPNVETTGVFRQYTLSDTTSIQIVYGELYLLYRTKKNGEWGTWKSTAVVDAS